MHKCRDERKDKENVCILTKFVSGIYIRCSYGKIVMLRFEYSVSHRKDMCI